MDNTLEQYLRSPEATNITMKTHECVLRRYMLTLNGNGPSLDSAICFLKGLKGLSITSLGVYKTILQRFLSWYFGYKVKLDCPWITDTLRKHMKEYFANKSKDPLYRNRMRGYHRDYHRDYYRENYIGTLRNGKFVRIRGVKRGRPNDTCELCGRQVKRLAYHHWDDNNTIKGMWLCQRCHMRIAEFIDKVGLSGVLQLIEKYVTFKTEIDLVYGKNGQG